MDGREEGGAPLLRPDPQRPAPAGDGTDRAEYRRIPKK